MSRAASRLRVGMVSQKRSAAQETKTGTPGFEESLILHCNYTLRRHNMRNGRYYMPNERNARQPATATIGP